MILKNSLENSLKPRLEKLRNLLSEKNVEAYLFEDPHDIFYLTGLDASRALLIVSAKDASLFVDGRYLEAAKALSSFDVLDIKNKESFNLVKKSFLKDVNILGFDASKTSVERYLDLKETFPYIQAKSNPITELRQIKDEYEIGCFQKSSEILIEAMQFLEKEFKEGVTEKHLSNLLECKGLELGADKTSFRPIVAFGKNAAMPHYKTGEETLKKNTLILIDAGFMKDGYASDMTRCFFYGEAKQIEKKMYDTCLLALKSVLQKVKAGVEIQELDALAREVIEKEGFDDMPHSLGHGIGLELHEKPILTRKIPSQVLKENMVVTIEPGIYLPGIGGVRLEEMILVTKTGYKNFYKNYSI